MAATTSPTPPTFARTLRVDGADVTVHEGADDRLLPVLAGLVREHGTLYAWASSQPQPRALRGRAPVYVAQLPDHPETVVVRHVWHGGLLAPLTRDRFRRPSRAPHEMSQSTHLRRIGIPTTTILGFARYDAGPGFCRVDVVTRFVPEAYDLGLVLAGLGPDITESDALAATRVLLGQLARARVIHPDLNVKNVLLSRTTAPLTAMVIDVDVVQHAPDADIGDVMQRNLHRLGRSFRKWRTQFGIDMTEGEVAAFLRDAATLRSSQP